VKEVKGRKVLQGLSLFNAMMSATLGKKLGLDLSSKKECPQHRLKVQV